MEQPATLDGLALLLRFVDESCGQLGLDAPTIFALRLAVEEVCMNLIRYGYRDMAPGPIRIDLQASLADVTVRITDRARPFHPSQAPPPDLTSDLEHRPIGGLGWHLVKQVIDHIEYQSDPNRGNVLKLVKRTARKG